MAEDLMRQAYDLGVSKGIPEYQLKSIAEKAARGETMQKPTAEKQAVYDAYTNYYTQEVTKKAQAGQALSNPNQWKNDIYSKALQTQAQGAQASPQQTASNEMLQQMITPIQQQQQNPQSTVDINAFLAQSQADSDAKMQSIQQYLQQSSQAQIQAQQSQLALARDQQLAEIDQALQQAINNGEISVREAEKQYNTAKEQINQQAYVDSELTSLQAQNRGIQNSAQMVGLMQGDQARKNSMLNQNLTTRDEQVNAINNQLKQMEYDAGINKSIANSQYNYGLAGAEAQINAELYNNIANLTYEEFARLQAQQTQYNQLGLQQQFNRENMNTEQLYALQQLGLGQQYNRENAGLQQLYQLQQMAQNQNYTAQNMATEQKYTQENMQTQQNFDLEKLSTQQKYTLEQMATSFGYDLSKMSVQQQYTLAQMAQSFGYDMSLQSSQQNFQAGQNALDRNFEREIQQMRQNHDLSMLNEEQRLALDQYDIELQRKLASVTPGTTEYQILQGEADFAYSMAVRENQANFAAEIGATELANLLSKYPTSMPDPTDKKAVDAYNSQVESTNKQIQKLLGTEAGEQYIRDLATAKGKSAEESNSFTSWLKNAAKNMQPITHIKNIINNVSTP